MFMTKGYFSLFYSQYLLFLKKISVALWENSCCAGVKVNQFNATGGRGRVAAQDIKGGGDMPVLSSRSLITSICQKSVPQGHGIRTYDTDIPQNYEKK